MVALDPGPGSHGTGDIERNGKAVVLAGLTPSALARGQTLVKPTLCTWA